LPSFATALFSAARKAALKRRFSGSRKFAVLSHRRVPTLMSQQEPERCYLTRRLAELQNNNFRALSKSGFAKRLRV